MFENGNVYIFVVVINLSQTKANQADGLHLLTELYDL